MGTIKLQMIKSEKLKFYSNNSKVNNIVRTLIALNGTRFLWKYAAEYLYTIEAKSLNKQDIDDLYVAIQLAKDNDNA